MAGAEIDRDCAHGGAFTPPPDRHRNSGPHRPSSAGGVARSLVLLHLGTIRTQIREIVASSIVLSCLVPDLPCLVFPSLLRSNDLTSISPLGCLASHLFLFVLASPINYTFRYFVTINYAPYPCKWATLSAVNELADKSQPWVITKLVKPYGGLVLAEIPDKFRSISGKFRLEWKIGSEI